MKSMHHNGNGTFMPKLLKMALFFVCYALTIFSGSVRAQACTLCSQADVDSYELGDNLGNHFGSLNISGPDITNLDSLYGLKQVFLGSLNIYNNPMLENVDGLGTLTSTLTGTLSLENNAVLSNLDGLQSLEAYIIRIVDNPLLLSIGQLGAFNSASYITISNNPSLRNLDGFSNMQGVAELTITDNTSLNGYCGLNEIVFNDLNEAITISGNLTNPSNLEILYGGTCGVFVRNSFGYPSMTEALLGASDHSTIYVTRDHTIDANTTFLGNQNHTLFIMPDVKLSFTAPFTNEGIVINHGTLEMLNGAVLTNIGPLVNTGTVIAH